MLNDYPFIRDVRSPLDNSQLRALDPRCEVVQFSEPLSDADHQKLSAFMRLYPDTPLRAYAHYEERAYDLEFLRFYPELREFEVSIYHLDNIEGLRWLPKELSYLGIGITKKRHSLGALSRFAQLKNLHLEGHTKDLDVVGSLVRLQRLSLRSITLPSLSILLPLAALNKLEIRLGGTKDLSLLPRIGTLHYLELWMVKGLSDLNAIAHLTSLRSLFLQALKNVVRLPSLRALRDLKRVHIETMKGLTDLTAIAEAPALEELLVIDMRQLTPDSFTPFLGHASLKAATIGLGSLKRNTAAERLLNLPKVSTT